MEIGKKLSDFWAEFTGSAEVIVALSVSVLVFAVLYFYMIKFLLDNKSGGLVSVFVLSMILGAGIISLSNMDSAIYLVIPAIYLVVLIVLYSVELKRIIWAHMNMKLADVKHAGGRSYDEEKVENCISEIIKALQNMSKSDTGAIIVLSTGNIPSQIIDSGVRLEADISSELIESVFFPKTPLHDGAMIISDTKIVAAGCFLPLSQNVDNIPKDLGTRHRAGIGITETIDVVSLIVSEETGIISIARAGRISRYADFETLKKTLNKYYWQELESARK
ncbi:MAG: DNA integrity scanning protein DisA nucleotide-binding domain protein [Clostridia bacterium]|nr:DNA integrity scanning protein DisA nucleotide-binding domain protein [Clostridia bacterium]